MGLKRATRRRLKPEERRRIAELYQSSSLSRKEFAGRHRISLSSLQRWLAEARSPSREFPDVLFQEVTVSPPLAKAVSPEWAVEIVSADGMTVRCREGLSIEDLVRLLQGRTC